MKAVGSKILVKIVKSNDEPVEKAGGFIIPDSGKVYEEATITSVGDEIKADIKDGDTVIIYKGAGTSIKLDEDELRIISISDILVKKD